MVIAEIAAEAKLRSTSVERTRERLVQSVPAKRLCTTDDVGALVAWLAQPESAFITGQAICVNGGAVLH
jgi:NAD(P)-dependent dehydrogenase (short-subunit alcohol dehydrogenase family)